MVFQKVGAWSSFFWQFRFSACIEPWFDSQDEITDLFGCMLENLIGVYYSVFGHVYVLDFLDDDVVLWFDVVIEETMVIFEFDVFAEEPELIPLYFVVEPVFGEILFELVDSDPGKVLSSKGRTFFLSFKDLVFKGQFYWFNLLLVRHWSELISHRYCLPQLHFYL